MARHQVATLRSSERAQGFDSSALRNCVGRSSVAEHLTVDQGTAVRIRPHPLYLRECPNWKRGSLEEAVVMSSSLISRTMGR